MDAVANADVSAMSASVDVSEVVSTLSGLSVGSDVSRAEALCNTHE